MGIVLFSIFVIYMAATVVRMKKTSVTVDTVVAEEYAQPLLHQHLVEKRSILILVLTIPEMECIIVGMEVIDYEME